MEDNLELTIEEQRVLSWLEDKDSQDIYRNICAFWPNWDMKQMGNFSLEVYKKKTGVDLLKLLSGSAPLVLFGAGGWGSIMHLVLNAFHVPMVCFADNNLRKQKEGFLDLPVLSAQQLWEQYPDAMVAITVTSGKDDQIIAKQLLDLGYPHERIVIPANGFGEQYFDFDHITWGDNEIMVDAGCLDGADSLRFAELCGGKHRKILAFEPDADNRKLCEERLGDCPNCTLYPYGLWDRSDTLSFFSNLGCSRVTDEGLNTVEVRTLDQILQGEPITFLKMDIEGAELKALHGAANTIRTHKPKLAICIYHRPEDRTTIPLFLKELVPGYRFALRHYAIGPSETVLYAY